jgi:hypothetical protein
MTSKKLRIVPIWYQHRSMKWGSDLVLCLGESRVDSRYTCLKSEPVNCPWCGAADTFMQDSVVGNAGRKPLPENRDHQFLLIQESRIRGSSDCRYGLQRKPVCAKWWSKVSAVVSLRWCIPANERQSVSETRLSVSLKQLPPDLKQLIVDSDELDRGLVWK